MKVLGLIPARGGSKGIPGKNIKPLNGSPLISCTIKQALQSSIDEVVVSTDCEKIAEIAKRSGANVPFIRPAYLSSSASKSIDVVIHAVEFFLKQGKGFDAVCLLQPTSPYRPFGTIDKAINQFVQSKSKSLVSVRKIPYHYNPYWSFEKIDGALSPLKNDPFVSRRQDLPDCFHRDGAIYITEVNFLLKENSFFSDDITGFEIVSPELVNIDTPEDWEVAERVISTLETL